MRPSGLVVCCSGGGELHRGEPMLSLRFVRHLTQLRRLTVFCKADTSSCGIRHLAGLRQLTKLQLRLPSRPVRKCHRQE